MSTGNQQLLQRYAQPIFTSSALDDVNAPFSYKAWYDAHQGIIPGQEFNQYNEYLLRWYKEKGKQTTDFNLAIKLNYLTLLRQLQIFFSKEETENWYRRVNLENEKELLLAIPYFAKKLKEISLYYLQLRSNIKESRLKYNQTGTSSGIIQQIQKFILTNYTKKPDLSVALPASIWKDVPELSSVKDFITVQIEELYDTQNYFDQVPTLPASAYYNVNDVELERFLHSKGLQLSDTEWIYKVGMYPLTADYVNLSNEDISQLSLDLATKYLGSDKFVSTTATFSAKTDFYDINISEGNNFFYWPFGVYGSKTSTLPRYQEVDINDAGLETIATAGSSIETSDTLFVQTERGTEGAWLRHQIYDYKTANMEAFLVASEKTLFRFPFPGYGLSAEDTEWSGYSLTYDPRFFFLETALQQSIQNEYWSSTGEISLTSTEPININDTTLVASKAYPNRDYNRADKITVWGDPPEYNEASFSGYMDQSWLYRMDQTDISIGPNNNIIFWPYEKISQDEPFPTYFAKNLTDVCEPITVSELNTSYAVAGDALSSADVIYKVTNFLHTPDEATECCWLSGTPQYYPDSNLILPKQNSLQLLLNSGEHTTFIWTGGNGVDLERVFKTIKHQPDCKYARTPNVKYTNFDLCDCKQVMFVPFGHPGPNYNDYNGFADYIVEGKHNPGTLNITEYVSTSAFAWYKTNTEIGFGDGSWVSGLSSTNNKFFLQDGKIYTYYRALIQKQDTDDTSLPNYVVRYNPTQNQDKSQQVWVHAYKTEDNKWISSNTPSVMSLTPGELLLYKRASTVKYSLTGTTLTNVDISENRGSIWSNYDYVTIDSVVTPTSLAFKNIIITYPYNNYASVSSLNLNDPYKQYPAINFTNILKIDWSVKSPDGSVQVFKNSASINLTPTLTGIYSVSMTAVSSSRIPPSTVLNTTNGTFYYTNTGIYVFSNIPPITAEPILQEVPTLSSYSTNVPGYVLNTKLYGWDYGNNAANKFARTIYAGAKPFWAKTYQQKDQDTKYKSVNAWGTPQRILDEYNIVSQPEMSDLALYTGDRIEYNRKYPVALIWNQPVDLIATVDKKTWCTLEFITTADSNVSYFLENYKTEFTAIPTTSTSNIQLRNYIDNKPVEIHYNALTPFIWSITATPTVPETIYSDITATKSIEAVAPWANLTNQNYPTVAALPVINNLFSKIELGGYFIPKNLGAGVYINQDYTATLSLSSPALSSYFEDITKQFGARGLTNQEQSTPYENIVENNIWLKEPLIAGPIAGTIKKKKFKKHQKFIPYQSGYETNPRTRIGMLTPTSRQSPWTGREDSEWGDVQNFPQSPTGEINVKAWADTQILKQSGLQVDNWCTDIFGNQYGLYKNLNNTTPYTRKFVPGEIWARKNSQFTSPASIGLRDVFDTYANTSLIHELTGNGIRKIDMFFDTLLVETSGVVIFEKLNYDFTNDNIFSLLDEARYLSLAMPVGTSLAKEFANTDLSNYNFAKAGETWFFPEEKQVTLSVCGLEEGSLTPELYQLDLNTLNFKKIFPVVEEDVSTLAELTNLNLTTIDPPVLSHNNLTKEYLLTILGKDSENKNHIIELKIKNLTQLYIEDVTVYAPLADDQQFNSPSITQKLETTLDITNIEYLDALNFQCVVENGDAVFEPLSLPEWMSLSPSGKFTGTPPLETTTYVAQFKVTNNIGPTYYSFIVNVNYTEILTYYYLYTEGYSDDGYLVQEEHNPAVEIISKIIE